MPLSKAQKVSRTYPMHMYQLKVTLRETQSPIWRRIQVPSDITLAKLHRVFQCVVGWTNSHLHRFIIGDRCYGQPDPDRIGEEVINEKTVRLNQVVTRELAGFIYEYDFGDRWEHEVVLEKILPLEAVTHYPVCLEGARRCPPENCGGVAGYAEFLDAIQNPDHPQHDEMLDWVGGRFDPESFDLEVINRALRRIK